MRSRVSTRQQKTDSQKAEIQRWLKGHGLNPKSVQWFEDHESGKSIQLSLGASKRFFRTFGEL